MRNTVVLTNKNSSFLQSACFCCPESSSPWLQEVGQIDLDTNDAKILSV